MYTEEKEMAYLIWGSISLTSFQGCENLEPFGICTENLKTFEAQFGEVNFVLFGVWSEKVRTLPTVF